MTLLFGVTVVLIFTRTVWLSTLLVIGALGLLLERRYRTQLSRIGMWTAGAIVLATVSLTMSGVFSRVSPVEVIYQRFMTIIVDNVQDPNAQFRFNEAQAALARMDGSWLLGAGFRASIATEQAGDPTTSGWLYKDVGVGHNGYLSLLLDTGLVGLSAFGVLAILVLKYCWNIRHRSGRDPWVWAMSLGIGLTMVRILMNGLTESTFTDSFTVPLFAIGFALLEHGTTAARISRPAEL
jgi:O-antigen ligase